MSDTQRIGAAQSGGWIEAATNRTIDADNLLYQLREYVQDSQVSIAHWKRRAIEAEAKLPKVQP